MKAYIMLNKINGWKVVKDGTHVDCTNPICDSEDISLKGLQLCKEYCTSNKIDVIRICQ